MILHSTAAFARNHQLQQAIAMCQVETTKQLLEAGADANARDALDGPILRWMASGRGCDDVTALATAKLLDEHGAHFENLEGVRGPSLLVNLAPRGLPKTLAFLVQKKGSGDPTQALKAIARKNDVESIRVLLRAGADPLSGVALSSALFDASVSGQGASVLEMLKYVKDKQSPKVRAAYEVARKNGNREVARIFLESGVRAVESVSAPLKFPCQRQNLTSAQVELLKKLGLPNARGLLGLAGAMTCKFVQKCGDLILIDCNSAADGPAYYINERTTRLMATCGGACMKGCTGCPPQEWTCECKF